MVLARSSPSSALRALTSGTRTRAWILTCSISGMFIGCPPSSSNGLPARIDAARVAFEDLLLVRGAQAARLDIALRVVVVLPGLGIDAAHRANHLGGEKNVIRRYHLEHEIDARLVVDAGVEEDVLQQEFLERRALHVLREAAVAPPVEGHRAAPVRDDEAQRRKILEEIGGQELHERGRVGVEVVRAGGIEV